jgi:helicase
MALLATFIGIDKHADPRVRDLTGARRDATALWCLFTDSLTDVRSSLLRDEEATVAAIRKAMADTLTSAGPDDTVVFSFAGHGTRDHRLVAHDTRRDALTDTTIPMYELASAFKASKARAILCILDCCFSGGAPARVLDDSPVTRDPGNPLEELVGTGRVLLSAAHLDEVAYEHPTARHGLLTKAIIEVLQAVEKAIGVGEALDRILDRVRADAAQIGVRQTPMLVNRVEGGLELPALRRGDRFAREFPDLHGVTVTPSVADLAAFGIPSGVLDEWAARFSGGLNVLQVQAVNQGRILDGASLLVVAPTSSGKTFIGEMAAVRAIGERRKAVFLLPYKALVNEKFDQFRSQYGERLGYRVIRCTGDYADDVSGLIQGKYDLALLTYEMFLQLALNTTTVLNGLGLVVLDEAQFITDPTRGITVELLLTFLLAARERGLNPQLLTLSAVIGDVNDFDAWLGCRRLVSDHRPVPLIEGVIDRGGAFQYLDLDGTVRVEQLLPPGAIVVRRQKASAQDVLVPLIRKLVGDGEKVIVFRNQRGSAQGCASYLAADLALPSADEVVARLPERDRTSASAALRACLAGGTAFHTTNLSREEREVVERAFRQSDGKVYVLAATTTVAAGINTPADTVILAEQEFLGEEGRPFTVAEYKNMAGRAGRLGIRDRGRAVIYAETPMERQQLFERYVRGTLEPLRSSFDPEHLETWLVRLLAQVDRVSRTDAVRLLSNCFGGFLANRGNPKWHHEMGERLEELLAEMLRLGLLEEERGDVRLTLLGRACGRSSLSFASALRLIDLLRSFDRTRLTGSRLVALLQGLAESDALYTPISNSRGREAAWSGVVVAGYGEDVAIALQRFAPDADGYVARCKRAAVLWDWMQGTPLEHIETRYSCNPYRWRMELGDVRRFADLTRFHLQSARQIISVLLLGEAQLEQQIDDVLKQLEIGIPAQALDLLNLPIPLTRGEYLALCQAGIIDRASVWGTPQQRLQQFVGDGPATRLKAAAPASATA